MLLGGVGDAVMSVQTNNTNSAYNQAPIDNLDRVEAGAKVEHRIDFVTDKLTGKQRYRHADISVGNGVGALEFVRSYSSTDASQVTELGRGWRHNYMISVEVQNQTYASLVDYNNPVPPLGQFAGLASSGPLIQGMIQIFLAPGAGDTSAFVIGAISTTEASKLLTSNVAIVRDGDKSYTFTLLSNGTYLPPKGLPMLLQKLSDRFVMQNYQGVRYTFTNWALKKNRISKIEWPGYGSTARGLNFTYGGVGPDFYLTSVSSNAGRSINFTYNLIGGLVPYLATASSSGLTCNYTIDAASTGLMTSVSDSSGAQTSYQYDGNKRLTSYTRPDYQCTVQYAAQDRVTMQTNPGYFLQFSYGGDTTSMSGGPEGSVSTRFNSDGKPIEIATQAGTTKFAYDGLGRLDSKIMPGLDTYSYMYDQNDRVTQEIHSPGPGGGLTQTRSYGYVSSGQMDVWTSHTDERNQGWSRTIDANGKVLTQTGPTGTKTMGYTQYGDLASSTDETGITTTYAYGNPGDMTSMVVDSGAGRLNLTSTFGYDVIGNRTNSTNARGFGKTMTFDSSRRVTSISENGLANHVTNFGYDLYGNVVSTAKQISALQGQMTTATYSGVGDLLSTTDPIGFVTSHAYNALGQRISTTDPELRQRQFQYDSAGRLLVLLDANGVAEETRTYNSAGYLTTIKDARNNLTTIARDGFGRALTVIYPGGSFESYTFDVSGNPLTHRMRNGNVITNTFDGLGRIATKSPQGQAVVTFSYDNASRLLSVSTPVVSGNPSTGVFSHGYDTAGRLISETNPQAQVMSYTLDANGNAARITHPGGYFVDRVYDQLDRLTNIKLNGSANSAVTFGYDPLSRRTSKNYLNGANTSYSYDLGNNLLTMNIAFVGSACNWTYTYNKVHQMLSQTCSDTSYYWRATAGTGTYAAANNLNQYPTVGGLAATYNTLGALATYNTWTYSYNTEQMLTAATNTGTSASFVYDPKLRQIQKNCR